MLQKFKKKNKETAAPRIADKPKKGSTLVVVEMPEEAVIKLVQENLVRHYETLSWLFNASTSLGVGLWTAYFTLNPGIKSSLFFSALAFSVLSLVVLLLVRKNRREAFSSSVRTTIKMKEIHK